MHRLLCNFNAVWFFLRIFSVTNMLVMRLLAQLVLCASWLTAPATALSPLLSYAGSDREPSVADMQRQPLSRIELHVDCALGSDDALGGRDDPLRSVQHALRTVAAAAAPAAVVVAMALAIAMPIFFRARIDFNSKVRHCIKFS